MWAEGRPFCGSLTDEEPVEEVVDQERDLDGVDAFRGYLLNAHSLFSPGSSGELANSHNGLE
jgi:hypothetical protein